MLAFVPALGRFEQAVIIALPLAFDEMLQADVAPHLVTGMVKQKQRQQASHAAIAVEERMDAEEVKHVGRDQQNPVYFLPLPAVPKE